MSDAPARRGRPPLSDEARAQRRAHLVETGYEVFVERGYAAATIGEITRRAGMAQGAFYRHCESKRALLDDVVDHVIEQLLADILAEPPEAAADAADLRRQFEDIAERLAARLDANPGLVSVALLELTSVDDEMTERIVGLLEVGASLAVAYLDHGVRAGYLRADLDTAAVARALLGVAAAGLLPAVRGRDAGAEARVYLSANLAVLFDGIVA